MVTLNETSFLASSLASGLKKMEAMKELKSYILVDTPENRKQIETKRVFKVEENEYEGIAKYKARWVVKCYMHTYCVEYYMTHSSASRLSTLRVLLSLAMKLGLKIQQMDVNTAILNAFLNDLIYLLPPPVYEHLVPKLKSMQLLKSLYGFKQAPR